MSTSGMWMYASPPSWNFALSKDTDNILMSFILVLVISSSLEEAKGAEAVASYLEPPEGPGPLHPPFWVESLFHRGPMLKRAASPKVLPPFGGSLHLTPGPGRALQTDRLPLSKGGNPEGPYPSQSSPRSQQIFWMKMFVSSTPSVWSQVLHLSQGGLQHELRWDRQWGSRK